jgi:ankyrin repeat protein
MGFQWTPGGPPNPDPVDQDSQIHIAVAAKRINAVKSFLARTPELANRIDRYGWTPMYRAVYDSDIGLVKLLLDSGANPDIADTEGWTPRN